MNQALQILAGPKALAELCEHGLRPEAVDVFAAASGGPKWLVLAGLDRVLFRQFLSVERPRPLHLIGSSIGSWRMACLAQQDPIAALDRFEAAYLAQRYHDAAPEAVTRVSEKILEALLGDGGAAEIVQHPWMRMHVLTTRCRGLLASERRPMLLTGLGTAAIGNVISRRSLGLGMQRAIFHTVCDDSPFRTLQDLPTVHIPLTRENLPSALLASASVPLVLAGVRIPGAPEGMYRDGGVVDYHPDLQFGDGAGLVLYPHFYSHVTPGWFDKFLPWRAATRKNFDRAVILAPTSSFVAGLPGGRIPDRKNFYSMDNDSRLRMWNRVLAESRRLGDEFGELQASGRWAERVQPLPWR